MTGEVESIVGNEVTLLLTDGTESSAQATATYLLPVGMPIGTGDYSTVSTGMVLELSLDADGDVVAASVR